jgi:hypothetical protein
MKPTWAIAIIPLLLFTVGIPLSAQFVTLIDAPFTGTLSATHNGQALPSAEWARASNGSTYEANLDATGRIIRVTIRDVPNHRRIELYRNPPSYTYRITPEDFRGTESVERYRKRLQGTQERLAQGLDHDGANGSHQHETALGVEQGDGTTIFKRRDEITLVSGEKETVESWESDLGFAVRRFADSPTRGLLVYAMTNLRRVEPDPKLFEIPPEYLPHPDPLLDGKRVFVDNETGVPEVKDVAVTQFNAFGPSRHPWVVVDSMDEADIIAVFANVVRTDDLDPPFEMKIHVPSLGRNIVRQSSAPQPGRSGAKLSGLRKIARSQLRRGPVEHGGQHTYWLCRELGHQVNCKITP